MRNHYRLTSALTVTGICLGFIGTVFSVLCYMAKDYSAYNSVYAFFGVRAAEQIALTRFPISKLWLLRMLNLSHILFVLCAILFVLLFSDLLSRRLLRVFRSIAITLALVQAFFLDPEIIIWLYMKPLSIFKDVLFFRSFYQVLTAMLRWISILSIVFSIVLLIVAFFRTPRSLRTGTGLVALFFTGISLVYLYLFSWLPIQLLWLSRVARYVGYDSLPVYKPTAFNHYLPLLSLLFVICFCAVTWHNLRKVSLERRHDEMFDSKISAVDTVSRVFCHYLKNELLAQQAELRLLLAKASPALCDDVAYIIQRNDEIYQRLNAVRETMRLQKLTLNRIDLLPFIRASIEHIMHSGKQQYSVHLPDGAIYVSANPEQIQEVLACLIRNAIEAKEDGARISINATILRRYVSITIGNNGPRIARNEWETIFDPFYTTKPTKNNWGLGLALCKNIITLHHGRIWVDELLEDGLVMTTFHILLPLLQ